jgi:ferredoxin
MGRSFLIDESINSLLFFVVFFFHMLIPLALGVTLWLHLARISRPHFITRTPMTVWVLGSLLLLSIAYPADSAEPARMTALPQTFSMDWWYLLPVTLTDRLGGGALWSLLLASSVVTLGVPWYLARGRAQPARVTEERCNACRKCYQDCPYDAISMVPRTDGHARHTVQAFVDPARCVGCGICAGSCDTAGIGLDWFSVNDKRGGFVGWLKRAASRDEEPYVAFVCAESAGASLTIDPETGACEELPGYLTLQVPCGGWIHPLGLEHTLRFGGKGAIVVTCPPGECRYREGAEWERMRIEGDREPLLRTEKVKRDRVLLLSLDRTRKRELVRRARAFREGQSAPAESAPSATASGLAAALLAVIVAAGMGLISDLVYATPRSEGSELVVTFKHPGQIGENCRELSEAEKAARPVHMRQDRVCDRARASVRLRVALDGEPLIESTHAPLGIWSDGNSVAVERVSIEPGEHRVRVEIGDSADPQEWTYVTDQTLTFTEQARRVIAFDRLAGFTAH